MRVTDEKARIWRNEHQSVNPFDMSNEDCRIVASCDDLLDARAEIEAQRKVIEAGNAMRERLAAVMEADQGINEYFADLLVSVDAYDAARAAMGEK